MNKIEFIKKLSEKLGKTQKESDQILSAFIELIKETLKNDEEILIKNFGSFQIKHRKERQWKSLKTGEMMTIPAKKIPHFKINKGFKKLFE